MVRSPPSAPPLPTGRADLRLVARTVRLVLSIPTYAAIAVVAAALTLTGIVLSQNLSLAVGGGALSTLDRARLFVGQYPFVGASFSTTTGAAAVAIAALTGLNLGLVGYHLREHDLSASGGSGSALGVAVGVLGAGCAACGSALLVGLLSLVGAGGLVLALPLDGLEVSLLAIVLLALSTYWLAEGMRGGAVRGCPVDAD